MRLVELNETETAAVVKDNDYNLTVGGWRGTVKERQTTKERKTTKGQKTIKACCNVPALFFRCDSCSFSFFHNPIFASGRPFLPARVCAHHTRILATACEEKKHMCM